MAKILVACEESQRVCVALRQSGHDAYSCDLIECSGAHPEWHIREDVIEVMQWGFWDAMIAFPPCTDLAIGGARHWKKKQADGRQQAAAQFFMRFVNSPIPFVAIENPVGYMNTHYRKADQIIQPYLFGEEAQKRTCLWLKGFPPLTPTNIVGKGDYRTLTNGKTRPAFMWSHTTDRAKQRSKTFQGIADAMGKQWGAFIHEKVRQREFPCLTLAGV